MLTNREIRAGFRLLGIATQAQRKRFRQFEQLAQLRDGLLGDEEMDRGTIIDTTPLSSRDDHAQLAKNARRSTGKGKPI